LRFFALKNAFFDMIFVRFTAVFWLKMAYISDIQVFTQEFQQQKKHGFFCVFD